MTLQGIQGNRRLITSYKYSHTIQQIYTPMVSTYIQSIQNSNFHRNFKSNTTDTEQKHNTIHPKPIHTFLRLPILNINPLWFRKNLPMINDDFHSTKKL